MADVIDMYRMEPVEESQKRRPDFTIELEIGNGVGRNMALLTDVKRNRSLSLALDADGIPSGRVDEESLVAALTLADHLAVGLLVDKASPSDMVLYVLHRDLSAATAKDRPFWQHHFRYVKMEIGEVSLPWWKLMGISGLDDLDNPRRKK